MYILSDFVGAEFVKINYVFCGKIIDQPSTKLKSLVIHKTASNVNKKAMLPCDHLN